jgi:hypothetical protein
MSLSRHAYMVPKAWFHGMRHVRFPFCSFLSSSISLTYSYPQVPVRLLTSKTEIHGEPGNPSPMLKVTIAYPPVMIQTHPSRLPTLFLRPQLYPFWLPGMCLEWLLPQPNHNVVCKVVDNLHRPTTLQSEYATYLSLLNLRGLSIPALYCFYELGV